MNINEQITARQSTGLDAAELEKLRAQYGFSDEAIQTAWRSVRAGGGVMAQFSHPELGGTGQWTRGGMIMIGDMFNQALKARVAGLCSDLATLAEKNGTTSGRSSGVTEHTLDRWWGTELGVSAASGSQNDLRYAYFPSTRRLAVLERGQVTVYDTGDHEITGVSQQQSAHGSMRFTSQRGSVALADLPVVKEQGRETTTPEAGTITSSPGDGGGVAPATPQREVPAKGPAGEPSEEVFRKLERVAELREKIVISDEEFRAKKTELLARL